MLKISYKRMWAVVRLKLKIMLNGNMMLTPALALGFTILMRVVYSQIVTENVMPGFMVTLVVNLGLSMNIGITGIFVASAMLAEEKENHTLRVLMTSSVTAGEFFMASMIPLLLVMMIVNLLILPISGLVIDGMEILVYILITTIASLTSCVIGLILGVFAKNQVNASSISTPALLVFVILPTFSVFVPVLDKISKFLFTGVLTDMVEAYATNEPFGLSGFHLLILIGEIVLAFLLFAWVYRRNGYEKD